MTETNNTAKYIMNEMERIEDDFNKTIYLTLGMSKIHKGLVKVAANIIQNTKRKDIVALNYFIKLKNALENVCLITENIDRHYQAENKEAKEYYVEMFANVCKIIGITISTITFDRFDQFASLLVDFNQGNYAQVEEHLIDSLLDYEEGQVLEGLSLIQRYCPDMPIEIKHLMAKDMTKWSDLRNMK